MRHRYGFGAGAAAFGALALLTGCTQSSSQVETAAMLPRPQVVVVQIFAVWPGEVARNALALLCHRWRRRPGRWLGRCWRPDRSLRPRPRPARPSPGGRRLRRCRRRRWQWRGGGQCDVGSWCGDHLDRDHDDLISQGEWDDAFNAADTNGDGQVSQGEFQGVGGNWGGGRGGGR